ncbi:MAG: tandem-95 repeat protein, partial [Sulfuritalea sp.]|nr:tandem-95 repeat protein [Sulfuritalea sp.]
SLFQSLKEGETTTDRFTYTMVDGEGATSTATVTMTIVGANDAPVVQDDSATLLEDGRITLALMSNASDIDGDALTLRIVEQPAHGMLTLNADNTVTYLPTANYNGEDVFTYLVNDGLADSNVATVRLVVNAVADAPTLVLSERPGATREVFRSSWETASDDDEHGSEDRPPLVKRNTLEGWTLLDGKDHGDDHRDGHCDDGRSEGSEGFELWTSGDKMKNAANKSRVVTAAADNGTHWLELSDAKGEGHQTTGIERQIDTVAGATYTLSLDLAGHLGYSAEYTRIGLYLDGVKIGTAEDTSPNDALAWTARSFSFTGAGRAQTLRIIAEPSKRESNGRGMMVDDIALSETLPANTGREDGAVPLSAIGALLSDTDGSETLTLSIAALPVGATLSDGTHSFTASASATTADVTGWNLGALVMTPPLDFNGSLSLQVIATATEQANGDTAITLADLNVTVLAVNDAPLAANASYAVEGGGSIKIDFASLVSDVDGNILTLTLGKPKHGSLLKNTDGSYTYTPKRGYRGTESFSYTVSDGTLNTTATITVVVSGKRDDDEEDDHHGEGNGHCARLVVQSGYGNGEDRDDDKAKGSAILSIASPLNSAIKVDWQGSAPNGNKVVDDGWAKDYFVKGKEQKSLAELTGLTVRLKK